MRGAGKVVTSSGGTVSSFVSAHRLGDLRRCTMTTRSERMLDKYLLFQPSRKANRCLLHPPPGNLRALEPAFSAGLLALVAFRKIWLTFDFLLSAGQTGLSESFSRLSSLCDAPVCVHRDSVNNLGATSTVGVDITQTLSVDVPLVDHMRTDI